MARRLRWSIGCLVAMLLLAGCRQQPQVEYESSVAVRELEQPLQAEIREALLTYCGTPAKPKLLGDDAIDPAVLRQGEAIYQRRCVQCHGVTGDGNGPVAQYLSPLPRDYRSGIFKFTSVPYGARPRRGDLVHTIYRGVPGTAMPSFDTLSPEELDAVVDYVLVLTRRGELESVLAEIAADEGELDDELIAEAVDQVLGRWQGAETAVVVPATPMPEYNEASIARGREAFLSKGCIKCHGPTGRGGFLGNVEVGPDLWGHKTAAADLSSGMFHGGGRPIDLYRRIASGIYGSPMPGFASTFTENPDDLWHLVHFIMDLGDRRRRGLPPIEVDPSEIPSSQPASEDASDES